MKREWVKCLNCGHKWRAKKDRKTELKCPWCNSKRVRRMGYA